LDSICTEETAVLERCRKGSKEAFESVVRKYMKNAYFIALGFVGNREDALDLSQEAFFRAYRNIDHLNANSKFFPWFYQILRNLCFSHLRKTKKRQMQCFDESQCQGMEGCTDNSFDPGVLAERNELQESIWEAIGQLDEKHREVIILRHFQNLSYEQIAQTLYYSKGTVMSRLYYARKRLKELLAEKKGGRKE